MRGLCALLLLGCMTARAVADGSSAVWWQPSGEVAPAARARAAFARSMAGRGATVTDAPVERAAPPSLLADHQAAIAEYRAFRFVEATAKLTDLVHAAERTGGGDLDTRQLAELYLYRGLSQTELAKSELAWDDFVRAARLDPTRVLDPAQFPPRAVGAWRRAVADAAQLPRAELELEAPEGAVLRVDGRTVASPAAVTLGAHFVRVAASGAEPWSGMVNVTGARERLQPPLKSLQPPDADALSALAAGAREAVLGALERGPQGWRFVARRLDTASGRASEVAARLDAGDPGRTVEETLRQLLDPPRPVEIVRAPPPRRVKWWVWAIVGGVAASLAVAIPVGIVYSQPTPTGTFGGSIGPLR